MADRPSPGLDFDRWAEVARTDPATFERMRREAIEAYINSVPEPNRERLRRLQWRIDQERRLAGTPLAGCIRLSRMMWQAVLGNNGLLDRVTEARARLAGTASRPPPASARVLPFVRRLER
jgi:hypothetical protein